MCPVADLAASVYTGKKILTSKMKMWQWAKNNNIGHQLESLKNLIWVLQ